MSKFSFTSADGQTFELLGPPGATVEQARAIFDQQTRSGGLVGLRGGDVVSAIDPDGREIARGLVNYNATEARKLCRKATREIGPTLGYVAEAELIHRDNLVLV